MFKIFKSFLYTVHINRIINRILFQILIRIIDYLNWTLTAKKQFEQQ